MDPLIVEFQREQRLRTILVVATVIGIIAGAVCGSAASLGAFGWGFGGPRSPAGLVFFVAPFAIAMALGYGIHAIARRLYLGRW